MQLTSPCFDDGGVIPVAYTSQGKNKSPELVFREVPQGAVSLALVMHDPDGYRGDFLHWVVWNVSPATVGILDGGGVDGAVVGLNDKGKARYMGPAPLARSGVHRYVFELYALDAVLSLGQEASRVEIEGAMAEHEIARAVLVGLFER